MRFYKDRSGLMVTSQHIDRDEQVEFVRTVLPRGAFAGLLSERGERGVNAILRDLESTLGADIPVEVRDRMKADNAPIIFDDKETDQVALIQIVG